MERGQSEFAKQLLELHERMRLHCLELVVEGGYFRVNDPNGQQIGFEAKVCCAKAWLNGWRAYESYHDDIDTEPVPEPWEQEETPEQREERKRRVQARLKKYQELIDELQGQLDSARLAENEAAVTAADPDFDPNETVVPPTLTPEERKARAQAEAQAITSTCSCSFCKASTNDQAYAESNRNVQEVAREAQKKHAAAMQRGDRCDCTCCRHTRDGEIEAPEKRYIDEGQ